MQISFTIRLKMYLSSKKNPMSLVYRVISCNGLGGSLACAWNSQMPSSIVKLIPNSCRMQYHENVKLSTRDREEYTGHEKL